MAGPSQNPMSDNSKQPKSTQGLSVKWVLQQGNALVKRDFFNWFQATVIIVLVLIVFGSVASQYVTFHEDNTVTIEHQSIIGILGVIVLSPLFTGLYVMGVQAARGNKITVFDVFKFLPLVFLVALTQLLISILVQIGTIVILPGVYLWMASVFALPLVAEKRLSPIQAIITSCRGFNKNWSSLLAIYGVMFLLFITVPLSYGLTILWVMPLYFCVMGITYAYIFDEAVLDSSTSDKVSNESHFNA